MKLLKLIAKGARAIVPTSMVDDEPKSQSSGGVRNNMAYAYGSGYTNVIPNRSVSSNRGKYTPPPKRVPWVVIPEGVCKNC